MSGNSTKQCIEPINPNGNAIDVSSFVILFDRSLRESEFEKLGSLEAKLKTKLPSFNMLNNLSVQIAQNTLKDSVLKQEGVILQKFKTDGNPAWVLKVDDNSIAVECHDYKRWAKEWKTARGYLREVCRLYEISDLKVRALIHRVADRFILPEDYKFTDLFKPNDYVTERVKSAGKFWHVYQGWFEYRKSKPDLLNNLNMVVAVQNNQLLCTIDHTQHTQYIDKPKSVKDLQFNSTAAAPLVDAVFIEMHKRNKQMLIELLNDDIIKTIDGLI